MTHTDEGWVETPPQEWEPGVPLIARGDDGGSTYRAHVFTFRDDTDSEECKPCPDAATWPTPRTHVDLDRMRKASDAWDHAE